MLRRPIEDPRFNAALVWLGRLVRECRILAGWTQRQLEYRSGVHQSMISRFERGLVPGMRVENVAAMLAAFRADDFIEHRMIKYVLDGPLGERLRAAGEIGPDGRRLRAAVADAVQ